MPEQNNPYAEYSSTQLYMDAEGKGAKIAEPVADPNAAVIPQYFKPLAQQQVQEEEVDYLANLFDGENLSEEFKLKATTIFEAAINEKVAIIEQHILAAAKEVIEEQVGSQQDQLVEHIDGYLNYVISEWMEENKVAIENGLRTEIAENFINGLKSLFETSFIDVPQEKYNILDDLYEANSELQENVNGLIKENMALKNEITARLCAEAFINEAEGLADTQVERLASLAEGIEFSNVDQYRQKVALLKESYFGNRTSQDAVEEIKENTQNSQVELNESSGSFVTNEYVGSNPIVENIAQTIRSISKSRNPIKPAISGHENPVNSRIQNILNTGSSKDRLF